MSKVDGFKYISRTNLFVEMICIFTHETSFSVSSMFVIFVSDSDLLMFCFFDAAGHFIEQARLDPEETRDF